MIIFGELLFWLIIVGVVILEGIFIYCDKFLLNLFSTALLLVLGFFFVKDLPSIDWRYLALYPIGSLIWLPAYWYLSLLRNGKEAREYIEKKGSIEEAYRWGGRNHNNRFGFSKNGENYSVYINNPSADEIVSNSLFFPLSIFILVFENVFDYIREVLMIMYNTVKDKMESIRKSIEEKLNGKYSKN